MLQSYNLYILRNVPRFHPSKNVFNLTLHTLRQSLDWPLISILTSHPMHKWPIKKISWFLNLQENCKSQNSQKVPFDR